MNGSKYQPLLTIDYMVNEPENKFFDRKSSKVRPSDLADIISAFANAEGGTIVIGVNDKTREIEGINSCGEDCIRHHMRKKGRRLIAKRYKPQTTGTVTVAKETSTAQITPAYIPNGAWVFYIVMILTCLTACVMLAIRLI